MSEQPTPQAPPPEPATGGATDGGGAPATPDAPPPAAPPAETPPWEGKTPEELGHKIAELTKENATYKERFRPYEDAFGSFHEDDQQFILGFFNDLRSGDPQRQAQAAADMRAALDSMSPAQQQQMATAVEQQAATFDPFNPEDIDKRAAALIDARLAKAEQERQYQMAMEKSLADMAAHTKTLADKHEIPDFGDPSSTLGRALLISAHNDFPDEPDLKGRLDRAAEKIQQDLALRSQELLQRKSAGAGPSPVPAGAAEPSGVKKPRTMAEAHASARERVDAAMRGVTG